MKRENTVSINPDKLKSLIIISGKSQYELSEGAHFNKNYLASCLCTKEMASECVVSLRKEFGFNPRKYVAEEDLPKVLGKRCKTDQKKPVTRSDDNLTVLLKAIDCAITAYLNAEGGKAK